MNCNLIGSFGHLGGPCDGDHVVYEHLVTDCFSLEATEVLELGCREQNIHRVSFDHVTYFLNDRAPGHNDIEPLRHENLDSIIFAVFYRDPELNINLSLKDTMVILKLQNDEYALNFQMTVASLRIV